MWEPGNGRCEEEAVGKQGSTGNKLQEVTISKEAGNMILRMLNRFGNTAKGRVDIFNKSTIEIETKGTTGERRTCKASGHVGVD